MEELETKSPSPTQKLRNTNCFGEISNAIKRENDFPPAMLQIANYVFLFWIVSLHRSFFKVLRNSYPRQDAGLMSSIRFAYKGFLFSIVLIAEEILDRCKSQECHWATNSPHMLF